jgi:hypothetical protein
MEEFFIEKEKYKQVFDGFEQIKKYKTIDDEIFDNKEEAEEYEEDLIFKKKWFKIQRVSTSSFNIPNINSIRWAFASNQDELNTIVKLFNMEKNKVVKICDDDLAIGKWIGQNPFAFENKDYYVAIYTWDYVKKQIQKFIEFMDNKNDVLLGE